jgi:hypothetical protein
MGTRDTKQRHIISWIIFVPTIAAVFISLIPSIFPAFLLRTFGGLADNVQIEPFETGLWAYPIIIVNVIVFSLFLLYSKNHLPQIMYKSIWFVFSFEISPQMAFVVIVILIGFYTVFSVEELFDGKFDADYYNRVKPWLESFDLLKPPVTDGDRDVGHHLQIFFESTSMKIFGNYKVIPFIASIALPIMTYFLTAELTKKRFAGIVSMVIVLQSSLFLFYDTGVSYPNFWILFYLLSLYLIYKMWQLSAIAYTVAILSKGLTAIFFPVTIFFIIRTSISKKRKIYLIASYTIIVILGGIFFVATNTSLNPLEQKGFNLHNFVSGFGSFSTSFKDDGLILLFFLPLIVGLFIASRKGIVHAESIMLLLVVMLLSAPFLSGFSDHQNVPYRFVPVVTFFAIGAGLLLAKSRSPGETSSAH